MTAPLSPPVKKNPLVPSRLPMLPPAMRSRTAQLLTLAAAEGRFALQKCSECGTVAYPPRDACSNCLGDEMPLTDLPSGGTVRSETEIHASADLYFRERLPWRIGLVEMDCGPMIVAHLHGDVRMNDRITMSLQLDKAGNAAAFARPVETTPNMTDDRQWREMTSDPKYRRVLVTAGRRPTGQALAAVLAKAGAHVFLGLPDDWIPCPAARKLAEDDAIETVPLNPDSERSVRQLCAAIGGQVDILVNTTDFVRPGNLLDQRGSAHLQEQMQRHFMGFAHLSKTFGAAMRARGGDDPKAASAWLNVFSAYALVNTNPFGAFSAVQAGCLSLSHALRSELRTGGVRVINVFAGPTDGDWYQTVPPPKLSPRAIATAVLDALRNGLEEVYVGDIAKDYHERLTKNPKAEEREFGTP